MQNKVSSWRANLIPIQLDISPEGNISLTLPGQESACISIIQSSCVALSHAFRPGQPHRIRVAICCTCPLYTML